MIGLTGSPRIAGTTYAEQAEVEAFAVPLPELRDEPDDAEGVIDQAYRVEGRVAWSVLTAAEARALQADASGEFEILFRTTDASDPAWAEELAIEVVATSDAVLTGPVRRRDGSGVVRYFVEVEVESLRDDLTRAELGLDVGAIELHDETDTYYRVEAVDGATLTDTDSQFVTIDTEEVLEVPMVTLGDDRTVAARVDDSDPYVYRVQTRLPAPS